MRSAPPSTLPSLVPKAAIYLAAAALVCILWGAAIWAAGHLHADTALHRAALFAHLAFLVVGFGAVLTLDWLGALWVLGRLSLADVLRMSGKTHAMIWLGLVGLTASGMLLNPHLDERTWVKLVAVLVVALNGLNAHELNGRLDAETDRPGRWLLVRAGMTAGVSQAGWWTACFIGYLNGA